MYDAPLSRGSAPGDVIGVVLQLASKRKRTERKEEAEGVRAGGAEGRVPHPSSPPAVPRWR